MQGRLAWCVANQRTSWSPVEDFDRAATDPLLDAAAKQRAAGHPGDALELLERAEQAGPEDPRVPFARGEILEAQGRLDDAIAAYRRAVTLDPNQAMVLFALGRAYKAAGQRHKSVFFFEQASWRAGEKGPLRAQADSEVERGIFPLLEESGFADGAASGEAVTVAGAPRTEFAAGDPHLAWWAKLGPHWTKYSEYFQVRWVDPSGAVSEAESPEHPKRAHLAALRDGPLAPGTWRVQLVLSKLVVHEARVVVKP
jgi:tetratricopeptide (TPR) repeat protein